MPNDEWRIGKYIFDSQEEYEQAQRDSAFIRVLRHEHDLKDPKVAKDLYNKLRFQEGVLKSPIGKAFFYELSDYMAQGELEEKRRRELEAEFEQERFEKKRSEGARLIWPDEELERREREEKALHEKRSKRSAWLVILAAVSLLVLFFCIAKLAGYGFTTVKTTQNINELKNMIGESAISIKIDEDAADFAYEVVHQSAMNRNADGILEKYLDLYEMNRDLVGWVSIEDTRIDYPVMQNLSDSEYYLHLGYDGKENEEGLPFLDWHCIPSSAANLLIYGHNMKNGHMFADLMKYEKEDFFKSHRLIRYDSIFEEGYYDIIAVFRTHVAYENEDVFKYYDFYYADNEEEFNSYIDNIKELSLYDTEVTAKYGDKLLTLSTCEYTVDDGRFVVVAKKIG